MSTTSTGGEPSRSGILFAARINIFALALSALWIPLNSLLLPGLIEASVQTSLRGTALGLVTFVGIGAAVLVQPIAGALSDSWGSEGRRRGLMLPAAAVMAITVGVLALAPGLWWLLGLYVLLQVAGNVAQSASQALIPDLVPSADIDRASGIKNGLDLAGTLLGLSVAGGLVAIGVADRAVLPFLAGLVAFGGVAVWKIVPSSPVSARQSQDSAPRTIGRAFAPLRDGSTQFKAALATRFLFLLGIYPIQRFLVFFVEDRFEVEDPVTQASAAIFAAVALGAVAAAVAGPVSDAIGRRAVLAGSILVTGAGVPGAAVVPTLVGSQSQVARLRSAPVLSRRRTGPHSPAPYPKARVPVTSGSRTWRRRVPRRRSDFLGPSSMG